MPGEIWIGYAGTLGTSYDLPLVFEAIKEVNDPNLRFIVMGDGPLKHQFEDISKGLNVTFTDRLPYEQMCGVLVSCDIVMNPIIGKSVASIINKHADYAACGKPVLNTQKSEEYRTLVKNYEMGFNCDNKESVVLGIEYIISNVVASNQMGLNARRCAKERFDRRFTYKELIHIIYRR
ncbi:Glycosyl transferases group 1 [Lachnospiraceae bacterium RM5]|nr:Glycosyl transferases group 1 [Lachnospiraceae bacterium RM5]